MGGDGTVSKVINAAIDLLAQQDDCFNPNELEDLKSRLKTPFCILSTGSVNMIASSIYATSDINTPLMHLIYGFYPLLTYFLFNLTIIKTITNFNSMKEIQFELTFQLYSQTWISCIALVSDIHVVLALR